MEDGIEELLDRFVYFINQVRENPNSPRIREFGLGLAEQYYLLKRQGVDCISVFDKEFATDTELYLLVLSVFFFLFKEKEFLDKAEMLLLKGDLDYFLTSALLSCINGARLGDEKYSTTYQWRRAIHKKILKKLHQTLSCECGYIPYAERNHRRVVLMTDSFLGEKHAPTKSVVEMYRILRYDLGYDVMFVVAVENGKAIPLDLYWMNAPSNSILERLNGNFKRRLHDVLVEGYQLPIDQEHIEEMRSMIRTIYDWKPECVWYAGGESFFGDLFSDITTLMVSSFGRGYGISDAPVLISSVKDDSVKIKEMEQYIQQSGQKMLDLAFAPMVEEEKEPHRKSDFGLPEDQFIIAIVGNRLDLEINCDFIHLMDKIAKQIPQSCFMLIGKCDISFGQGILCDRVKKMGFREDLAAILGTADLFLNPVRSGGGFSAATALTAGVPVITLGECDVASYAGDAFIVDSMEQVPELVERYCNDKEFYQHQIEMCTTRSSVFLGIDNTVVIQKMIESVQRIS